MPARTDCARCMKLYRNEILLANPKIETIEVVLRLRPGNKRSSSNCADCGREYTLYNLEPTRLIVPARRERQCYMHFG